LAIADWLAEKIGSERSVCVAYHYQAAGADDKAQKFYSMAAEYTRSLGNMAEADDLQFKASTTPD
jgi:hypothetical protein